MAGNEKEIAKFLIANKSVIPLIHLGVIASVGAPSPVSGEFIEMGSEEDVDRLLSTQDSKKKADIYINGHGVSLKQKGSTFSYNRLQRANLDEVFRLLNFSNPTATLEKIDHEVAQFHNSQLDRRNRPWEDLFKEYEFKVLTDFLMMKGAPNVGWSSHQAKFILEAPAVNIAISNVKVFDFNEYFNEYKKKFKIAIRRQWYGQASESEHKRARGLMKKQGNAPWVFDNVVGMPNVHRSGCRWRSEIPPNERKTVYFLMIEKER